MTKPTAAKWYSIRQRTAIAAAAVGALAAAEIFIYGDIGESWWEETTTAAQFVKDINALDVSEITVRINSLGGSVTDGLAIHNAIKRHKATVTTEVDGMAFSIASLIASAGDKRRMSANAMWMVHAPWTYMAGNSTELRDMADQLDTWAKAMATSYAAATGRDHAEMLALLTDGKDHYYTADEALAAGFIDEISDAMPPAATASAVRDVAARYKNVPAAWLKANGIEPAAAPAPAAAAATPSAAPAAATPAAAAAPQQEPNMPDPVNNAGGTQTPDAKAIIAAERARQDAIAAQYQPHLAVAGVAELLAKAQRNDTLTVEAAGLQLLAHLGATTEPVAGGGVRKTEDEADKRIAGKTQSLMARAGVVAQDGKRVIAGTDNPYRGMSLLALAAASLQAAGVRFDPNDKMGLVAAAFTQTTSDFPILLETTMHKTLQAAYALQPNTWSKWAKRGTVSDFRAHPRYRRGSFGNLETVNQASPFKTGAIPDGEKTTITALTKGKLANVTRQTIINDDLDALVGVAQDMGRAAMRTVEVDAIAVLTANAALTQDNVALFHADHANLGTGGVPTVTTFDEARQLMAKQTAPGGLDYLDIRPAYLLCPVSLGGTSRVINDAQYDPDTVNKLQKPNMVRGLLREVIDTPRLSGTAYYFLADPNELPTVEVAFLDGNDVPYLESQAGWTVDGTEWKVRLDYGTAACDFRGAVRNAGA
ncbi:MAG: ClpP-like prohead protease/major capsid protein fusion protein [Ramlibacter sp.]